MVDFAEMVNHSYQAVEFGSGHEVGEPIYIPDPQAEGEDSGYPGSYVYDPARDSSFFGLGSAANPKLTHAPIDLKQRVPHGLHGSWLAEN